MWRDCLKSLPGVTGPGVTGAIVATLLAACTAPIPPAVMIAGQAIDGISYLTTGKSGTDHALSAAMSEDCALHRIITLGSLCLDSVASGLQTASLGGDFDRDPIGAVDARNLAAGRTVPEDFGAPGRPSLIDHAQVAGRTPFWLPGEPAREGSQGAAAPAGVSLTIPPAPRTFVVLATYPKRGEADKASRMLRDIPGHPLLRPKVVSTLDTDRPVYRLVVGPVEKSGGAALRDKLARKGFATAAVMAGCDGAVTVSCVDSN